MVHQGERRLERQAWVGSRRAVVLIPGCLLELLSSFLKNTKVGVPPQTNYFRLSGGGARTLEIYQSSLSGSTRQPRLKSIDGRLRCQGKEFLFYSKYDRKPLRESKQGNDMICITFLNSYSHHSLKNAMYFD